MDNQISNSIIHFLVDEIIPRTPDLAEEYGEIQLYGALDLDVDQYVISILQEENIAPNEIYDININRLVTMGFYSEWSGYGSTRLKPPNERVFEFPPISWKQVGYPGPSLGYHALRNT